MLINKNHSSSSSAMATKLKKGMPVVKAWLVISESGQSSIEEIGKHSMMKRSGLPARDLRALDPVLSYPSSILGRERAIVVSLEHIRAIITSKEVLLINYNNPLVVQFVQDLQHRIVFGNNNVTSPHQVCVFISHMICWNHNRGWRESCFKCSVLSNTVMRG